MVGFLRNGKALEQAEPLCPLGIQRRPSLWSAFSLKAEAQGLLALSKSLSVSLGLSFLVCDWSYCTRAYGHVSVYVCACLKRGPKTHPTQHRQDLYYTTFKTFARLMVGPFLRLQLSSRAGAPAFYTFPVMSTKSLPLRSGDATSIRWTRWL